MAPVGMVQRPRGYGAEVDSDDNEDDEEEEENEEEGEIEKSTDKKKSALKTDGLDSQKEKSKRLHPLDIDAHWLQRKLAQYYDDATTSQQKSKEVLKILRDSENNRECENHLVLSLGYDCFDFIKILLKNRDMVAYCTLLKMAQSDEEREILEKEMRKAPHLSKILRQLEGESEDEVEDTKGKGNTKGSKKVSSADVGQGEIIAKNLKWRSIIAEKNLQNLLSC